MAEALDKSAFQGITCDSRHQCAICKNILREAVQLICGCRACKRCGDCNISDTGLHCPECNTSFKKQRGNYYYFVDKSIRKEIERTYYSSTSGRCMTSEKPKHSSTSIRKQGKPTELTPVNDGVITSRKGQRIQQESTKVMNGRNCLKLQKKVPIHLEQCSAYCGECDSDVLLKDLREHRGICWKLHLYNGKSFRSYGDDVQQCVQVCASRQRTGQDRMARTIMDGFSQLREMYCSIQDEVLKLRHDVQRRFTRPDAIEDPIYKTMRWKVENVSNRIAERCALTSRPFQSSQSEYNMCLKLEFHGDAFLVRLILLRGEHDESLQWPFRKRVIFSVLSRRTMDAYEVPPILPHVQRCRDSHGTVVSSLTSPLALRPFIIDNCFFIRCTVI